jgi:DNA topoisomerase-3
VLVTEAQDERFYSRGRVVKNVGWRAVTAGTSGKDEREKGDADGMPEQNLTRQREGDVKLAKTCQVEKKQTKSPRHYTEATLLSSMENPSKMIDDEELRQAIKKAGLGTPATRAEIIEKLINCFYIERHGKELLPTSKGVQLVNLVAPGLKTPELTAKWEQSSSAPSGNTPTVLSGV